MADSQLIKGNFFMKLNGPIVVMSCATSGEFVSGVGEPLFQMSREERRKRAKDKLKKSLGVK